MMKNGKSPAIVLVATLLLGACGEDPAAVNSGNLSDAEAAAIAEFLLTSTYTNAYSAAQAAPTGPQAVPISGSWQADANVLCPLGGSVDISAHITVSGDTEEEGVTIAVDMTEVHNSCGAEQEGTAIQFTLTGKPNVMASFDAESTTAGDVSVSGTLDGTLDWITANDEGTCIIDISYTASGNELAGTAAATLTGSVCGVSVTRELMVGAVG
ncbi:MAG: hypothetical protein P8170_07085 [Gemmatimonadota bacterium]